MFRKALLVGVLAVLGGLGLAAPAQASATDPVLYSSGTVAKTINGCTVTYNTSWVRSSNRAEINATISSPSPFGRCRASLQLVFRANNQDYPAQQLHDMSACGGWDPTCPHPTPYYWSDYNVLGSAVMPIAESLSVRID